jgi:cell division protein ZipA
MEIGGREILVLLGIILIVAILLDGFRRARDRKSGKLRVRRRRQPIFDDDGFDDINSELPGKARIVEVRDELNAEQIIQTLKEKNARDESRLTVPFREPEQERLRLEDVDSKPVELLDDEARAVAGRQAVRQNDQQLDPEIIVLHLMATSGEKFPGPRLLDALIKNGLRYGTQKIFHRHMKEDGSGDVLFSVTNAINPGIFELNNMDSFSCPGISFFMVMQDSEDPLAAFEQMLATVDSISRELGGLLKDEDHSALTRQTAEHYRQRIMDYNRRQLAG